MKNLLKYFGKAFDPQWVLNLAKRIKRWDLLFIDDHGKVVSFRYVRGMLISFGVVILILLGGLFYLHHLHTITIRKNTDLQNTLAVSLQESKALQQEVRNLMIRLAEAQSKTSKRSRPKDGKSEKKASADTKRAKTAVIHMVEAETKKQKKVLSEESRTVNNTSPAKISAGTSSEARPQRIQAKKKEIPTSSEKQKPLIYDFSAFHDSQLSALTVRFSIKKPYRNSSYMSGYVFVLMKENDHDQKGWLPLPWVELVAGKPSRIEEGHFFRIRNYKNIEIQSVDVTGPKTYRTATLLVFSPSGEMLLRKTYPIIINVPGIPDEAKGSESKTPEPAMILPGPAEIRPSDAVKQGPGTKGDPE